jgi:hypothetical protein
MNNMISATDLDKVNGGAEWKRIGHDAAIGAGIGGVMGAFVGGPVGVAGLAAVGGVLGAGAGVVASHVSPWSSSVDAVA